MPLTDPYVAPDGKLEQIYENVVLLRPGRYQHPLGLRPVALSLGKPVTPPGMELHGEADGVIFYRTDGILGFHVPVLFDHFIAQHGGAKISGNPLGEITTISAACSVSVSKTIVWYMTAVPPKVCRCVWRRSVWNT